MKISLVLKEGIYDCKIKITDSQGERFYYISVLCEEERDPAPILVDVFDNEFSISLIPTITDKKAMLNEFETNNWKDKLIKKVGSFLLDTFDKMPLHVGCDYHIMGLQDGDRLDITLQGYVFDTFDRFNLLELIPVAYFFFEPSNSDKLYKLTNAYEINRKDVLKFARGFAVLSLSTYPIQMARVKYLTRNKKVKKVLTKFNNLSDVERKRFFEKQEKYMKS